MMGFLPNGVLLFIAAFSISCRCVTAQTSVDEMSIASSMNAFGGAPDSVLHEQRSMCDSDMNEVTYDSAYFNDPRLKQAGRFSSQDFWFSVNAPMPVTIAIEELHSGPSGNVWIPLPLKDPATGDIALAYTIDDMVLLNNSDTLTIGRATVALQISGQFATRVRRISGATRDHVLTAVQHKQK